MLNIKNTFKALSWVNLICGILFLIASVVFLVQGIRLIDFERERGIMQVVNATAMFPLAVFAFILTPLGFRVLKNKSAIPTYVIGICVLVIAIIDMLFLNIMNHRSYNFISTTICAVAVVVYFIICVFYLIAVHKYKKCVKISDKNRR